MGKRIQNFLDYINGKKPVEPTPEVGKPQLIMKPKTKRDKGYNEAVKQQEAYERQKNE